MCEKLLYLLKKTYNKCKMSISPLSCFLNIAVGTGIWWRKCRMGLQWAQHRAGGSCIKQASFTHVMWCLCGSPHGCVLIPVSQIWLVFDAQCWLLSVLCFVSSSEVDGKASLSINPVMPMKLLCCTSSTLQIWKSGADFSVAGCLGLVAHPMLSTNDLYCFHVCF